MVFIKKNKLKNKQSKSLHPLDENEIQNKLYGHLTKREAREEKPKSQKFSFYQKEEVAELEEDVVEPEQSNVQKFDLFEETPEVEQVSETPESVAVAQRPTLHKIEYVESSTMLKDQKKNVVKKVKKRISQESFIEHIQKFNQPHIEAIKKYGIFVIAALLGICLLIFATIGVAKGISFIINKTISSQHETEGSASVAIKTKKAGSIPTNLQVEKVDLITGIKETAIFLNGYTIQVAVYTKMSHAQLLIQKLRERGYDARAFKSTNSRGKKRFRVYVGDFASKQEAQETVNMLKTHEGFSDCFIRKVVSQ